MSHVHLMLIPHMSPPHTTCHVHMQMALLCERCSGACAANADLSSTSETALLQVNVVGYTRW